MRKNYISNIFFSLILLLCCVSTYGTDVQTTNSIAHHHEHHHNEMGLGTALVIVPSEKEIAPGIHLHYLRKIKKSKFALGVGYEKIFDDHGHNVFSIVGNYELFNRLNLAFSPGVAFRNSEKNNFAFVTHLETSYEFDLWDFHLGPMAAVSIGSGELHYSLGLHLGYGF